MKKMNSVSKIFFLSGFLLLIFGSYLVFQRYSPKKLEFQNFNASVNNSSTVLPHQIIISDINIDLPIYPSKIKNNNWETTTKGVSYLASSPIPGDVGNSVIYGHNWESLFGPLIKIKPGQKVQIIYNNNSKKTFIVEYTQIVTSDQTHILNQTKDKRITLYTCTGFLDSKRFVAVAVLEKV